MYPLLLLSNVQNWFMLSEGFCNFSAPLATASRVPSSAVRV